MFNKILNVTKAIVIVPIMLASHVAERTSEVLDDVVDAIVDKD